MLPKEKEHMTGIEMDALNDQIIIIKPADGGGGGGFVVRNKNQYNEEIYCLLNDSTT